MRLSPSLRSPSFQPHYSLSHQPPRKSYLFLSRRSALRGPVFATDAFPTSVASARLDKPADVSARLHLCVIRCRDARELVALSIFGVVNSSRPSLLSNSLSLPLSFSSFILSGQRPPQSHQWVFFLPNPIRMFNSAPRFSSLFLSSRLAIFNFFIYALNPLLGICMERATFSVVAAAERHQ